LAPGALRITMPCFPTVKGENGVVNLLRVVAGIVYVLYARDRVP